MGKDKKKIAEKIVNIVLDITIFIFGIILLISIYNSIQIKVLKNSYSSFFGFSVFGVQTGSMADAINAGDWIIVKYADNIKIDDVVTYEQDGEFITHRVVEAYSGTYVTRGDANNAKDEPITKDQIVGKVVKVLPHFEILKKTLFNPVVLIALIVTLFLTNILFKKDTHKFELSKIIDIIKNKFKIEKKVIIKEKNKIEKEIKTEEKNILLEVKKEEEIIVPKIEKVEEEIKESVEKIEEKIKDDIESLKEDNISESMYISEDDLDKTMCFRVISVDKDEIEKTNMKIIEEVEEEIEPVKEKIKDVKEEEVKKTLQTLSKNRKRFDNIIEKVMYIKEKELDIIVKLLLDEKKSEPNYATIKDTLMKSYIDGKYYNYCGDVNVEYNGKNMNVRLSNAMVIEAESMVKNYKGSDKKYREKVEKFKDLFDLLNRIEEAYDKYDTIALKREYYTKNIGEALKSHKHTERSLRKIVDEVIKTQRLYRSTIKYTIDKLDTNMFKLNYNNTSIKNTYAIELIHNLEFSKIYSDYIVDKTYSEGIIAEDKIAVLMTLLSVRLIDDMLSKEFGNKYIIYIPESMYAKDTKLDGMFDMINDEHAKDSVITLLEYEDLIRNKSDLKRLTKAGFHFAVDINKVTNFKMSDQAIFELVDYIFISKKNPNKDSILLFIPKVLHDKIVYDEISTKVGS